MKYGIRDYKVRLGKLLREGRMPHGILLYGEGVGELKELVEYIGKELLGEGKLEGHVDYMGIYPRGKMQQIGAEEVREMVQRANQTPAVGEHKVMVIYDADRMNRAAANILLKTLEEPPLGTYIVLVTRRVYDLLDTIRSRCFQFRVLVEAKREEVGSLGEWMEGYREWMGLLARGERNREWVAAVVLKKYSLISFMREVIKDMVKVVMEGGIDEGIEDKEGYEAGIQRGEVKRFLKYMEEASHEYYVGLGYPESGGGFSGLVEVLEGVVGLIETNIDERVIVEYFMLESMKFWGAMNK